MAKAVVGMTLGKTTDGVDDDPMSGEVEDGGTSSSCALLDERAAIPPFFY